MTTYLEERLNWYDDNYRAGNALISDKQLTNLKRIYLESTLKLITLISKII